MASERCGFWFGTEVKSEWFPTPLSGAEAGLQGWDSGGSLLSGGGYQFGSFGAHRNYVFEWASSSSYEVAQKMADYANGTYGHGPLHFQLPTAYEKNVLPAHWADPALSGLMEGSGFVTGVDGTVEQAASFVNLGFPARALTYDASGLLTIRPGFRAEDSVFIPVPEGYTLLFSAAGISAGGAHIYAAPVSEYGITGTAIAADPIVTPLQGGPWDYTPFVSSTSLRGVRLCVGRDETGSLPGMTLIGMVARLVKSGSVTLPEAGSPADQYPSIATKPWQGGLGNSGVRFAGKPTMTLNNGVGGGQAGFAATFREVGSWMNR